MDNIASGLIARVLGRLTEWWKSAERAGLTWDDLQTFINDPYLRKRVIKEWHSEPGLKLVEHDFTLSPDQRIAKEILGENFISPNDVCRAIDYEFSPLTKRDLEKIPYSQEILSHYKDTHILFPLVPVSLAQFYELIGYKDEADRNDYFLRRCLTGEEMGWYFLRKGFYPETTRLNYNNQLMVIHRDPDEHHVKYPLVIIQGYSFYFYVTGKTVFDSQDRYYTRTSESCEKHQSVTVCVEGSRFTTQPSNVKWSSQGRNIGITSCCVRRRR